MVTAILLKALYVVGGAVVGWFGKKIHVDYRKWLTDDAEKFAGSSSESKTPTEKPPK